MPPKQIPGFYYDEEKKKYFLVQADHLAPAGSKHSKTQVAKEEQAQRKRKRQEELTAKIQLERIRRPGFFRSTLPGHLLEQQHGLKINRSKSPGSIFLQGTSSYESNPLLAAGQPYEQPIKDFACITMNFETSDAFLAIGGCLGRIRACGSELGWKTDTGRGKETHKAIDEVNRFHNIITSVSICAASGALITTTDAGHNNTSTVNIGRVVVDEQGDDNGSPWADIRCAFDDTTIWKAATYESNAELCSLQSSRIGQGSPSMIAIASTGGLHGLVPDQAGYRLWGNMSPRALGGEIINLAWMSPNVIALGYRQGAMRFIDVRTRMSAGKIGLQHPGFIAGMELADDPNRLIVAGFSSPLCLYDIRMARPTPHLQGSQRPNKAKLHSAPVVRFKDFANVSSTKIGLAVHAELGLVATGNSEGNTIVSSLQTGETLRVFNNPDFAHTIETLRFCENRNVPELWAATGSYITKYAWQR